MANIKIAQLTNQTALSDNDLVIIESATSTNKMTVGTLKQKLDELSRSSVSFTPNNGYYVLYNRSKREGNKIFINIVIGKTSGSFPANTEILVGTFGNIENSESQRFGGACGQWAYEMCRPLYCILGADKQLGIRTPPDVSNAAFASIQLSYIV